MRTSTTSHAHDGLDSPKCFETLQSKSSEQKTRHLNAGSSRWLKSQFYYYEVATLAISLPTANGIFQI
jgi:hypothetical protein